MAYELAKAYIQVIPTTKGIKGALEGELGSAGENAGKKAGSGFSSSFGGALKAVGKASATALAAGVGAMAAFTKSSVEAGMNFDSSMSQVAATMGKTMDELNSEVVTVDGFTGSLRDFAKEMGASTKFSATEAADALNYMALAGYDTKTSMEMLPNVLNLAAAGGMELATASDMVTDTQSALGLSLEETSAMVDQMAKASSKSNTSVEQLGDALLKIGATARQVKGGTQELSTILGVLADNGIKGSEGGTHLRNVMLSMQDAAKNGFVWFNDFAVQLYDANGKMRSLTDVIQDMSEELGGMSDEARNAALSEVFNKTDLASVNALLGTSSERWSELTKAIGDCNGAAQDMANTQLDNLSGDITIMQSAFEGLQIAISDGATPAIRESVQGITEVINGLNDLVSGVDGGAARIEAGFSQILGGVNTALPAIISMFSSVMSAVLKMVPELVSSIVQMLPSLFDQILNAVSAMIPQIAKVLPDLISAVVGLIVNLVSHLSEIITPIIQAIPQIIKSLVSALIQNLPALVQGVLDLVVSLAKELPTICRELVAYIPQLIGQMALAIIQCIPKIMGAVTELVGNVVKGLLGIKDPIDEINEKMGTLGESARNAWGEIQSAMNQEVSVDGLLSSMGRTTRGIQVEIDELEGKITDIISTRLQEQEGLRQTDIQNIKNYMEQIRELEEEKLSIYGAQANAQLEILSNMTNASAEQYAEQFGKLQAYDAQEREELDKHHNTEYVNAENHYQGMLAGLKQYLDQGGSEQDAKYKTMQAEAEKYYRTAKEKADAYYNDHIALIDERESKALDIITNKNNLYVMDMNSTYHKAEEAEERFTAATGNMSQNTIGSYYAAQYAQQAAFGEMIKSMDDTTEKSTAMWLAMAAQSKEKGGQISGDAMNTAINILEPFRNMPDDMKDKGTEILRGLTNGMDAQIPALKNKSTMTAEEIVNAVENYLGISSPSRVMKEIGSYTMQGLALGIEETGRQAQNAMQMVGSMLIQGIGQGMQRQSSWLNQIAANAVQGAVSAAKKAGKIESPSHVMRDEVGLMLSKGLGLGIEDGQEYVVNAIDEIADNMWNASRSMSMEARIAASGTMAMAAAAKSAGSAVFYGGQNGNGAAQAAPIIYITNNIDGADNPEEFASRLARQIQLEMRMA